MSWVFSLVLKLYAKWGWLVSHIFFCVCVCVLIDSEIFFNVSHFLWFCFKPKDASFSFGTSSSPPCQALSHVLLLLLGNTHGNNNWWSWWRGSHLPGVFVEQQSISHLSPVYTSYPLDPCSGEFHCWFGCWQPSLSLALKLCLSPRPGTCCSKVPCSEEPARHMASDHTLSFLGSFLELLKQSSGCLNYAFPFDPSAYAFSSSVLYPRFRDAAFLTEDLWPSGSASGIPTTEMG